MEALQLLQVSAVQGPCLTTIEEAGENDRPVHLGLRGLPDVALVFRRPRAWLALQVRALISLSRLPSLLITLPRYLKSSTVFSWVPSIERWVDGQLRQVLAEAGPLSCRG